MATTNSIATTSVATTGQNTTASSIAGLISGQVAGFNVTAAVDGLLGVQKFEISQLKNQQAALTARQNALTAINTAASSLRNTAIGMEDSAKFFGYTASLSSSSSTVAASNLLDVSGTNNVSAGQHSIVVSQIAQAQRLSSSVAVKNSAGIAATSASAVLNISGSFQIAGQTVSVNTSNSLNDIAASINQLDTGASATGVSASVMQVGSNNFRLILASDQTGATGFTIAGADLNATGALAGLQLGASGQANAYQMLMAPQDANISIDGLSISRSSNTITDALSGVTLNLKQANPAVTVTISIGVDKTALQSNVKSFISAYNGLQKLVNDQFSFNAKTGASGVLAGNPLLTTIQSNLSSSVLKSVPGLASNRNSLAMIGVEPDVNGQLTINHSLFDNFLATDPTAIRDVFVAQGSSSNNSLQFLTNGLNTPSGTYNANITRAATRASLIGTTNLSTGLAAKEAVTIMDKGSLRKAAVNLTAGQSQSSIIAALNTELSATYTQQNQLATALTAGGLSANGATTFSALGLGVVAGDTIRINGTLRSGAAVSGSYTVLNPATDTVSGLLSAIQTTFNQQAMATIGTNGKITLTDTTAGDSSLSISLTAHNEGGGTLAFGKNAVVTQGRYALPELAVASGNAIAIQSNSYGAGGAFSVAQSVNGLGIANQSVAGVDVAGTINGLAASGSGQMLLGSTGDVNGLAMLYTGTATGAIGSLTVGVGIAAAFDGALNLYSNPVTGLIQNSIQSDQTSYTGLTSKIDTLARQMDQQRTLLTQQFSAMQQAMSTLNSSSSFLTQQINTQNAPRP